MGWGDVFTGISLIDPGFIALSVRVRHEYL
jgi:hypothetical protein